MRKDMKIEEQSNIHHSNNKEMEENANDHSYEFNFEQDDGDQPIREGIDYSRNMDSDFFFRKSGGHNPENFDQ
jgi:hypothetical protein